MGVYEMIISNFVSAFFGFLFAIIVELIMEKKSELDIQRKVKESLKQELGEIKEALSKNVEQDSNSIYFRYQYFLWKTCVNSGYLFSVSGQSIFDDFVNIYSEIEFADDIEQKYFELYQSIEENDKTKLEVLKLLDEKRKEKRIIVLAAINKITGG